MSAPNKINVGYIVNHFVPAGVETFLLNLINNLDRSRFQPYLYIFYSSAPDYIDLLKQDVIVKHLDRKKAYGIKFFFSLKKDLQRDKIKILHTNNWSTFVEGIILKLQWPSLKLLYVQHGLEYYLLTGPSNVKKRLRKIIRLAGRPLYSELVSVSKIGQRLLKNEWNASDSKLIYNGIDLKKFIHNKMLKREDLDLSDSDFIICSVGRLMDVKNYLCLFKAIDILKSNIPNIRMLHIGEELNVGNKQGTKLLKFIKEKQIKQYFRFLGRRHDIPDILPLCDVFSLTSLSEGISLSLLEAQAAGLPAVVTNVGGNPEIVIDGVNGFLVASDNEKEVADKILKLYSDKRLMKKFSDNAKKRVQELFSLEGMVQQYQMLYQELVTKKKNNG